MLNQVPESINLGSRFTAIFLVVLTHLIVAWDVFVGIKWGPSATVSYVLQNWVREYPIIVFAAGVLAGHVCWPLK